MKRERDIQDDSHAHEYPPELAFILTQRPQQQLSMLQQACQLATATAEKEDAEAMAMTTDSPRSDGEWEQPPDYGNPPALVPPLPADNSTGTEWMLEFYESFDQARELALTHLFKRKYRMHDGVHVAALQMRSVSCASRRVARACSIGETKGASRWCCAVSPLSSTALTAPSTRK